MTTPHKEVVTEWYITECPLKEHSDYPCSDQSFERAWVRSYKSEDDCRERLRRHLLTSSLHWSLFEGPTPDDIETYVWGSMVEVREKEVWVDDQNNVCAPPAKKAKPSAGGGMDSASMKDMVGKAVRDALADAIPSHSGAAPSQSSSSAAGSTLAIFRPAPDEKVVISRQMLTMCADAMRRAKQAAKQSQMFFEGGASAFKEENRVIDDCQDALNEAIMSCRPFQVDR